MKEVGEGGIFEMNFIFSLCEYRRDEWRHKRLGTDFAHTTS